MFPVRLSIVTYNLWNTMRWPLRQPAVQQFVDRFRPDVLCVQELRPETRACLDDAMSQHTRVHDQLPGWACESNIYWHRGLFAESEHGAEDIGSLEEHRRLFWVRLKIAEQNRTIFVSTAHFTSQRQATETDLGQSPRIEQSRRTIAALQRLVRDNEPAWFMGDLNDAVWKATRFGFDAKVADPGTNRVITMAELVEKLVTYVRPSLVELATRAA